MIRYPAILFVVCWLLSCTQAGSVTTNVLSPAEMQNVLWDMMLADETADYYVQKDSSVSVLQRHVDWYQPVFQVHHLSKEDFKRSLRFYEGRPDLLKPIFDSLQKKAERQQELHTPIQK